jgi:inosine-uridine nucleoside N-ribohydrolase
MNRAKRLPGVPLKKIIIDTDPGIDDAVAIMFAFGSGLLDIKAITTVSGNLTADRCSVNARKILDLLGAGHIPVARGKQSPLVRPYPKDPFSHGDDGLANLALPDTNLPEDPRFAADLIIETVNAYPHEVAILGIGPLTNLALAVMKDPSITRKVSELIIIGGTYGTHEVGFRRATGDNPTSEWNIYVDPEAANIVFNAGFNLTAIGLDIAAGDSIRLSHRDRTALTSSSSKQSEFLQGVLEFVSRRGFLPYCGLIDSLAVAAAIEPTILTTQLLHVGIETKGELTLGQTVVDRREHFCWTQLPKVRVATSIDTARFIKLLLDAII